MADESSDTDPRVAEAWKEFLRREDEWNKDPTNPATYRAAREAFERYDRRRREIFKLIHEREDH